MNDKQKKNKLIIFWLDKLVKHQCTLREAAEATGYNACYMSQVKKRYELEGPSCLISKKRGQPAANRIDDSIRNKILSIYALPEYSDLNYKVFNEILEDDFSISIHYNSLRNIMREAGIKSPRSKKIKPVNKVHPARPRRAHEGDLVQLDGTPFEWFSKFGDMNKYCMQGSIDDATGKITALYMTEHECLFGVMKVFEITGRRFGIPREAYMDRAAWACVRPKLKDCLSLPEQLAGLHEKRTQIQRAMSDLNITQILAWSPQAKGRVERMWQTVQDRYPIWAFRHNVKNMADANRTMDEFVDYFNRRFSRPARDPSTFWRPAPEDLNDILCAKFLHKTNRNGCFKFHSYDFYIEGDFVSNKNFTLCLWADGMKALMENGSYYPVHLVDDGDYGSVYGDRIPQVVQNIIYENMFSFAKEVSA